MPSVNATKNADRNFVLQQGFGAPAGAVCSPASSALRFQGRVVGPLALAGTIGQFPWVFAALALLLWWSCLLPKLNPFDLVHNHTLGRRSGATRLEPAPTPRRFAQGMAATFCSAIFAAMVADAPVVAWILQALLLVAVAALVFVRFCLGSFVYHLLAGRPDFAIKTLPWGRDS